MKSDLEKLRAIVEASKKLTSILDLDELLNVILDVALAELEAERGTVFLLDESKGEIFSRILRGNEIDEIRLPLGKGIAGKVAETGAPIIVDDVHKDPRWDPEFDRMSGFRSRSMLCLPLLKGEEIIGVLQLLNKKDGKFAIDDVDYLSALAAHMVIAIENAKAHIERLDQERTKRELELAAQIQHNLLPQRVPDFPGLTTECFYYPCSAVGGDYYDFLQLPDNRLGVVIADVSGKGIPAALITSAFHAFLHASIDTYASPATFAAKMNLLLYQSIPQNSFLTAAFIEIEPDAGEIRYCNCGHNPLILINDGRPRLLKSTGTILGMFPKVDFEDEILRFETDHQLFLYTDGLTEATSGGDEDREEFGIERLLEACTNAAPDPKALVNSVREKITAFINTQPLEDDLTMIALHFSPPGAKA